MNFIDETTGPVDDHPVRIIPPGKPSECTEIANLVIFRKQGRIVRVVHPRAKRLTIGRSSSCSVQLTDPQLPGIAGEIVLGPVPMFRKAGNRGKAGKLIPVTRGKPFCVHPYTITVMEPGGVIYNRKPMKRPLKFGILNLFIAMMFFFITGSAAQEQLDKRLIGQGLLSFDPSADTSKKTEPVPESEGLVINDGGKLTADVFPDDRNLKTGGLGPGKDQDSAHFRPPINAEKEPVINSAGIQEPSSNTPSLLDEELDKIVKTAQLLIHRGDLKTAARTLKPLLPHTDRKQRDKIIWLLDPCLSIHFRQAYMLMPYEPMKAEKILVNIVESGLDFLPVFKRAKKILEGVSSNR